MWINSFWNHPLLLSESVWRRFPSIWSAQPHYDSSFHPHLTTVLCSCITALIDIMWRLCLSARLNNMTPVICMLSSLYFLQIHNASLKHSVSAVFLNFVFELFVIVLLYFSQAAVALQEVDWKTVYPMDFYSNQSLGPWTPNHPVNQPARPTRRQVSKGCR